MAMKGNKLSNVFRFPTSLFRNIYTLPRILPFKGIFLTGQKETSAALHNEKMGTKYACNKPTEQSDDDSSIEDGRLLVSNREKRCNYLMIRVITAFSIIILWLMMNVYLIVAGMLYDCPSDINGITRSSVVAHGSISITVVVMLMLYIVVSACYKDREPGCLVDCTSHLCLFSVLSGFFAGTSVMLSFGQWRKGEYICSDTLFVGELTYICYICVAFILFNAVVS